MRVDIDGCGCVIVVAVADAVVALGRTEWAGLAAFRDEITQSHAAHNR